MRIGLIADCYTPMRTSAAIMLEDLAVEFQNQDHIPIVIIPDENIDLPIVNAVEKGVQVLRVKVPQIKDVGYVRRTLSELYMPFAILRRLRQNGFLNLALDGVVWYSPSIFHGPLVNALKKSNDCKGYLILRDIFPEWAVDMGIMSRGIPYKFFKVVESYQYSIADIIGVQSPSNTNYFKKWAAYSHRKVEVLHNWLGDSENASCSISIDTGPLAGRKIFVYAGNMGVAQGMDGILDVIERLDLSRGDIGFLFIGRGSEVQALRLDAAKRGLGNFLVLDEIPHEEISGLYAQCHFGLVFLDSRHRTHNIPGKFISYIKNGLPVLACINEGNDLFELIGANKVGRAYVGICGGRVFSGITDMVDSLYGDLETPNNCRALAYGLFSSKTAVEQIIDSLN
jgi:glycosyltransferase involved in cell wall biosynthesis